MLKTGEAMKLEMPVTAYAVAHKAGGRMINAFNAFGLNVRHRVSNILCVVRFHLVYFGGDIRPWKRGAMWVGLALNLALVFPLANLGSLVTFIALFGVWSSSNYLHTTRRAK
jgi:hypothetical protein